MASIRRAFTLVELLVVTATIAVLAAVLFPVFSSAKEASLRTACFSNYKQLMVATGLYVNDYDDLYMPVNHQPASEPNSRNDRTWVQLVLPYVKSFSIFHCPSDSSPRPKLETTFDRDLVPGDTYSRFYSASLRSNVAYNYMYLSPVVGYDGKWKAAPKSTTQVASPSSTLVFVDSVWSRTGDGLPTGGGSWIVVPPCRYLAVGDRRIDTFANGSVASSDQIYVPAQARGWMTTEPESPMVYGGAWPWHSGKMTIALADGSVSSRTPIQLGEGCQVREQWQGVIDSASRYLWDLN